MKNTKIHNLSEIKLGNWHNKKEACNGLEESCNGTEESHSMVKSYHTTEESYYGTKKSYHENIVHIKLYGKSIIKAKCREYLNGHITQEFENGDFEFCFSVPDHETIWYGAVLSFGNKVRIIEPQKIKEKIIKTCKEILTEYEEEK